ncbi:uncharacterized protein LOC125074297 isoform X2 [Vanessa atalanta]|uniref:uncharacterized protein LOC125074297 isoform X2 n=1 Tax=Vanessa atalanta TaxID=42275 RepID=UPI001FCD2995|nr:uncharacterized protein LOC125074297 isoform X2 [Vanessa atalanta]
MSYCCSQCSFTAQFESALIMHRQLHHEQPTDWDFKPGISNTKSNTVPRAACLEKSLPTSPEKQGLKLGGRTSSATRLFEKLRARICRSKTLFAHPEEGDRHNFVGDISLTKCLDLSGQSECTSKAMKDLGSSVSGVIEPLREHNEIFACHLCSFDADRITVLDRHLLNDHKIGLDNLLKLVMDKTKVGLTEDNTAQTYGIRQSYYKAPDEIIEDGEFVIETVSPKIKILKHTASNTDLIWTDISVTKRNNRDASKDTESIIDTPVDECDKDVLFAKMETLNDYMSKFVDSSNNLKKVLTKELDHKNSGSKSNDKPYFNLGLGDQDSPRDWERAHSEKLERNRNKCDENRDGKMKFSSESFYF